MYYGSDEFGALELSLAVCCPSTFHTLPFISTLASWFGRFTAKWVLSMFSIFSILGTVSSYNCLIHIEIFWLEGFMLIILYQTDKSNYFIIYCFNKFYHSSFFTDVFIIRKIRTAVKNIQKS